MGRVYDNQINENGAWITDDTTGHCYDKSLSEKLTEIFESHTVYDFGCGPGDYTKHFNECGIDVKGYDGNPNTSEISDGLCGVLDLTELHSLEKRDWVMSLEVAEHIPKKYEEYFIQNLINHCTKGIVLSWALPKQPGDGHVNCQPPEYVISLMEKHGFRYNSHISDQLKHSAELWWFKTTLLCFEKNVMPKITFCIPSKNNRRYLEACIPSIRKNSFKKNHDIMVFVDEDNDGTVEWLESVKDEYNLKYIVNDTGKLYGIGKAYDKCVEESVTDIFMIFHADMMLAKDADLQAFKYLDRNKVVCATRIEPPLHPEGEEKIVKDFGMWPEKDIEDGWLEEDFDKYVEEAKGEYCGKITHGCFAPWMMYKEDFLEMGMHDIDFKSAREDSDVFNRLVLNGFQLIQSWESFVYHLTARAGQFQHGKLTKDPSQKSQEWQELMNNSTKEFYRKWGSQVLHDKTMMPIIHPKYDIGFVVKMSGNTDMLGFLEPWCSTLYVDVDFDEYIKNEQPNTATNLSGKIFSINAKKSNDIIVRFDLADVTNESTQLITQFSSILRDSGEIGNFNLSHFEFEVKRLFNNNVNLINLREDNKIVQSMWIGDKLSTMEQTAIRSFLANGHDFHLYTYSDIEGIPTGTTIKDGNEIIPESEIFCYDGDGYHAGSVSAFSNWFRYKLLFDKGGWWVDTDNVCLKPFNFKSDYVFSSEWQDDDKKKPYLINAAPIKAPKGSDVMKYCWERTQEIGKDNLQWGQIGPRLVKEGVEKHNLKKYVQNGDTFCPINYWDTKKIVEGGIPYIANDVYSIHLWNEKWRNFNLDKDGTFHPNCLYEVLKKSFSE